MHDEEALFGELPFSPSNQFVHLLYLRVLLVQSLSQITEKLMKYYINIVL